MHHRRKAVLHPDPARHQRRCRVVPAGPVRSRRRQQLQDIKNSDDFLTLLKELTNPGKDRYALATNANGNYYDLPIFEQIFGVPNKWRVDGGGKLTADIETDEFKAALEFMVKVAKAGCYYPGSQGWTKAKMEDAFQSGKAALIYDGLPALSTSVPSLVR